MEDDDRRKKTRREEKPKKKRVKTNRFEDPSSSTYEEAFHGTVDEYNRRRKDPKAHIEDRLRRYLRFGAILQAISELTGIPRLELVTGGRSEGQDQRSGHGPDFHAAHVIRVGPASERLRSTNPYLYTTLIDIIGHTQVVEREANVWHGIGGEIDRFQSENLELLASIDFNREYNRTNGKWNMERNLERLLKRMDLVIQSDVFLEWDFPRTTAEWIGSPDYLHEYAASHYKRFMNDYSCREEASDESYRSDEDESSDENIEEPAPYSSPRSYVHETPQDHNRNASRQSENPGTSRKSENETNRNDRGPPCPFCGQYHSVQSCTIL
ncbi:uncharacterized protein LOC131209225 [Anopheles bellator]|uniref:uncharacterized protein LOC131209225 n=1 Tax=Anopheles bellator TaxID=139047 RepID=UPI002649C9E7|nr:uncharacterized protein LOC131209225 [Anopheles bellator]XP_058058220.1 uncharacterized protein LOC131209225 [Anopheles bellator]